MLEDRFRKPVGFRPEMPCRLSYSSMPGTTKNQGSFSYTHSGHNHRAFLTALTCEAGALENGKMWTLQSLELNWEVMSGPSEADLDGGSGLAPDAVSVHCRPPCPPE